MIPTAYFGPVPNLDQIRPASTLGQHRTPRRLRIPFAVQFTRAANIISLTAKTANLVAAGIGDAATPATGGDIFPGGTLDVNQTSCEKGGRLADAGELLVIHGMDVSLTGFVAPNIGIVPLSRDDRTGLQAALAKAVAFRATDLDFTSYYDLGSLSQIGNATGDWGTDRLSYGPSCLRHPVVLVGVQASVPNRSLVNLVCTAWKFSMLDVTGFGAEVAGNIEGTVLADAFVMPAPGDARGDVAFADAARAAVNAEVARLRGMVY